MSKTDNGLKWPKSCFKCFKLVTKSSLPMSSEVMKIGSIILSPSERLTIKSGPLNIVMPSNCQTVFKCKEGLVCIFFLWWWSRNKSADGKGQKHHRKVLQRHSNGAAKNYYQKRRPVTGFKYIRLLHGNVPAHASEINTAFLKKEKVTVFPHLPYSIDLVQCDFFMFPKLK